MKYFGTLKECKAANPNAKWFYHDRRGVGGQTRWYASKRILKKAQEKLSLQGYSPEAAAKLGFDIISL